MARWVTAAILVWLAVAVANAALRAGSPYDEAVYRGISRNMLRTGLPIRDTEPRTFFAVSPPLALYANAALYLVTGDTLPAARLLGAMLAGGALLLLARSMGRALGGETAGLAACALLGLTPLFARELPFLEVDLPVSVLFAAAVWSWISFDGGVGGALRTGLLVGLAGLAKYAGFLLLPLIGLDMLLAPRRRHTGGLRRILEAGAVVVPATGLLLLWHLFCTRSGVDLPSVLAELGGRVSGAAPALGSPAISLPRHLAASAVDLNAAILAAAAFVAFGAPRSGAGQRGPRLRVVAAGALIVGFTAFSSSGARLVRYLDPAMAPLAALAGVLIAPAFEDRRALVAAALAGIAGAAALHLPASLGTSFGAIPAGFLATLGVAVLWAALAAAKGGLRSAGVARAALFLAIALGLGRSPLFTETDGRTPSYGREAGAFAAAAVPNDGFVAATSPPVVYHADRPYVLITGRSRPAARVLLDQRAPAVLLDAGFAGRHRAQDPLWEALRAGYELGFRAPDGVEVWLRRPR